MRVHLRWAAQVPLFLLLQQPLLAVGEQEAHCCLLLMTVVEAGETARNLEHKSYPCEMMAAAAAAAAAAVAECESAVRAAGGQSVTPEARREQWQWQQWWQASMPVTDEVAHPSPGG